MKPLGILVLDTHFPRIRGDIGNPASFDFPVVYQRLEGIGPADAVAAQPDRPRVMEALANNARKLAEAGAVGISTSCGFLALFQKELEAVSPVPVATSALLLVRGLKNRKVGVITASARNLTIRHLTAVGAPEDTPVEGMPENGAFAATFLADGPDLDRAAVERETIETGRTLLRKNPKIEAIVLECTNLPPYKRALEAALAVEVYDVLDLLRDFWKRLGHHIERG